MSIGVLSRGVSSHAVNCDRLLSFVALQGIKIHTVRLATTLQKKDASSTNLLHVVVIRREMHHRYR